MTNTNYLIIPDVHGRTFWKKHCLDVKESKYEKIIFLGDYLDPYGFEHISEDDALSNFIEIIEFKKENYDKVVLLLGNHDLHYFSKTFNNICGGSRKSIKNYNKINDLFLKYLDLFQLAYESEYTLFTHAGYRQQWADSHEDLDIRPTASSLNKLLNSAKGIMALTDVSYMRGGYNDCGSIVWAAVSEFISENDCPKYQIFGHSLQGYLTKQNNETKLEFGRYISSEHFAMLDTGCAYELDYLDGKTILTELSND